MNVKTYHIVGAGILVSLLFSGLLYPHLAESIGTSVSTDGHDRLGASVAAGNGLAFWPSTNATVLRGPIFPMIVASGYGIGGSEHATFVIRLIQSLVHGTTVLFAILLCRKLGNRDRAKRLPTKKSDSLSRAEIATGLIVGLHPFLLWYSSRIVLESTSTLVMTGLLFTTLLLLEQTGRKTKNALALGILIGLAALTKGVYLLFLLLIPIALVLFSKASTARDRSWRSGLTVTLAAVMVIAPWTVRNAFVSDRFVPVHILVGVNLAVGDHLTEELTDSPFAYGPIIDRFEYPLLDGQPFDMMTNTATRTVDYDRSLMVRSVDRYRDHPLFLAKKMSLQLLTFWALGSRLEITLVLGLLQSVLLFGAMAGFVAIRRDEGWRAVRLVPLLLVLVFWLAHAPLYAIGRFSIVLVPTLAAYCCWWFFEVRTGDRHTMTIR